MKKAVSTVEQRRAEHKLSESEERYRNPISNITDTILELDMERKFTYASPQCIDIYGYDPEEMIGLEVVKFIHPDDAPSVAEAMKKAVESGEFSSVEFRNQHKDGHYIPVSLRGCAIKENEKIRYIGVIRDVSERKRKEVKIEHLNTLIRAIRNVNQLIATEKDSKRMIKSACVELVETRGYFNAWITLLDESGRLVSTAEAGLGKDFKPIVEMLKRGELTDCGRRALKQSGVIIIEEPLSTCVDCPLAQKYGDCGAMTVRLEYDGKVYGLMSVSIPRDLAAGEEEQALFREVAGDIAFALHNMKLEEERRRAEEELRESEEKYRTILEDIEDSYFEVDIAGNFTFFNDPMCGIIGYPRDEMMGMNNRQYMDKENAKKVYQAFNRVYTTGKPTKEFDWEIIRKDGTKRFVEASVSLKRNSEGEPIGFRGIIRDITERKRAEEALRKSEEHYRLLADNVTDVIWTMDNKMQFTYISPSVTHQRGYSVEEAMALGMEGSLTPASVETAAKVVLEGLSEEKMGQKDLSRSWTMELEMYCKDGSTIWTEMEATFLRDPDGQAIGILGVARDITERKRAEEELAETMADLKRSNKELELFAYVASHDLQEPLRMVSSFTQLLAQRYKGKLDADADDFIAYAVDGANCMQIMINDLLAYSRVGTRGKPLQPTYCEAVIYQSLANLKLAIEDGGAVITHDPLPSVMADESQLVQLFQNLIDNAIKFRGDQPPRVHVGVESKDGDWVFSVRDNGIGIDPQYKDRIFVIFQRLHGKEEYVGSGMGLATCKKIVERHAGQIWVESNPGNGATFYFTMPKKEGQK